MRMIRCKCKIIPWPTFSLSGIKKDLESLMKAPLIHRKFESTQCSSNHTSCEDEKEKKKNKNEIMQMQNFNAFVLSLFNIPGRLLHIYMVPCFTCVRRYRRKSMEAVICTFFWHVYLCVVFKSVCMYVCMYMSYVCVCISLRGVYRSENLHSPKRYDRQTCVQTHTHRYTHLDVRTCFVLHAATQSVYIRTYMKTYILHQWLQYMCMCMYLYIYVYTHTHTHT
jgi:hypothetical protein